MAPWLLARVLEGFRLVEVVPQPRYPAPSDSLISDGPSPGLLAPPMTGKVGSLLGLKPYSSTSFLRNSSPSLRCFRLRQRKRAARTIKATAATGTTTATAILPPGERPEEFEEEALGFVRAAPDDLLADDLVEVVLVTADAVVIGLDDVEVRVMVFGCGDPSLVEEVSIILVTWKSELDDVVGAAAATGLVVDGVGAMTSEGVCEVVDIDVEVVSTMTALFEVVGVGTATAPGVVDRIT